MLLLIRSLPLVFLLTVFTSTAQQAVPPLDAGKLSAAQRLAERVYKETGDAQGAVKVFEEAGIARLIRNRPAGFDDLLYADLLEAYAGYLVMLPPRRSEAAALLKNVVEADPARTSAYRSLGNLYHQLYAEQGQPQFQSIYIAAYKKYVGRLREQQQIVLLPQVVTDAVFAPQADICAFAGQMLNPTGLVDLRLFFNPETGVERYAKANAMEKGETGISYSGFVEYSEGEIRKSQIDIDNDGIIETRYAASSIGNPCRRNLFYKQGVLMSNALLDGYFRTERLCGDARIFFVRHRQQNYLLEQASLANPAAGISVFHLTPDGQHRRLCEARPVSVLMSNMISTCPAPVCAKISASIDTLVIEEAQHGAEWLVTDLATLSFDKQAMNDPALKPYIESTFQYLADVDNNGEEELISRLLQQTAAGERLYSHRLFKKHDGRWTLWQPAELPIDNNTWFFVERFEDRNYLVAYKTATADKIMNYQLGVYLLADGRVQHLGNIATSAPRK